MQTVALCPGLLNFWEAGPSAAEPALVYDEQHTILRHEMQIARLTKLEYTLVLALLHQRARWQTAPGEMPLCLSVKHLRDLSESASEKSTHNALNGAKQKVAALGLQIIRVYGEDRYLVLFDCEVEGKPPAAEEEHE